jgi:hypothetical protein
MTFNVTLKREIIVNGKKYGSIDELPEPIRKVLEGQLSAKSDGIAHPDATRTKIIVNTQKYSNVDEMPQNVREAYQQALHISGLTAPKEKSTTGPVFSMTFDDQKPFVPVRGSSAGLRVLTFLGGVISILYLIFILLK